MEAYGKNILCVSNLLRRTIDNIESLNEINNISGANGWILLFIHKKNEPTYQKDLESYFGITRSTASKVVSLMEKKNLIIRESDSDDARLKKLVLTDEAVLLVERFDKDISLFEEQLTKDISEEELLIFANVMNKMEKNLGGNSNV